MTEQMTLNITLAQHTLLTTVALLYLMNTTCTWTYVWLLPNCDL